MSDIQTWSNTAASNNATPPNGFPEGMAPSTVNDAARELMAAVSRYRSDTDGVNTSAGTNTITLAASRTMTAYAQGDLYTFKAGGTNTGATTLNVDSLGAKDVQFNGAACTGGEIVSGLMYTVVYDGTQFQLMNASSYPAIDITTLEVTNIKAKDGTASITLANSTGVATIDSAVLTTVDINGGTIDGTSIGATTASTASFQDVTAVQLLVQAASTISFKDSTTQWSSGALGAGYNHTSFSSEPTAVKNSGSATVPIHKGFSSKGFSVSGVQSVTTQYGFIAESTITAATNNYGFYADIAASGTSRYQFYANGSAPSYFGGNTIVSVTDNTNAALRVTQLGTANSLEIEDNTNPDATPFIVDASGRLVQGYTTAVTSRILTAITTPGWQTHNIQPGVFSWASTATPTYFTFNRSKSGTVGTLTAVADGDTLGVIQFNGADNDASPSFNPGAFISAQVSGAVATNSIPARINFSTTAVAATSPTTRASIGPDGYFGIGATPTSAAQLLDLRGTNDGLTSETAVNTLRFTDTDTATVANQPIGKIEFYTADANNPAVGAYILSSAVGTSGGGTIRFGAAANAGTVAEVARVADTGLTVTRDTAGLGYGTGTGGTVTQATSRTTGVTLNKTNGSITLVSAAGIATWQSFTVTNSTVAATDVVILSQRSGTDLYMLEVTAVAAGSFRISFATTGGTTTEQPVFNFAVIKAVNA